MIRFGFLAAMLSLVSTAASARVMSVLSSRPDTVSGGDALIAVALPKGASASDVLLVVARHMD